MVPHSTLLSDLQLRMIEELESKSLFKQASDAAFTYIDNAHNKPAYPSLGDLNSLAELEQDLPDAATNGSNVIEQLARLGATNSVKYSGSYFGFVNGGALPVALAAKWLADIWDQNAALYVMSPIAAKLESQCEKWLKQLFALPKGTVAGLVGGTSVATLSGLAAARYRQLSKLGWDISEDGLSGAPKLRIIMGRQTHGTVAKMVTLLGFGRRSIEWVDCDAQGRMEVDKLPKLDQSCIVILQAGNVCSGAFDDFASICSSANSAGAWVHIDGAFGLWAAASAQFNKLTNGIELAQSWSVDGHKTLNTPYDCGVILCSDPQALTGALHQQGSYIQASDNRDGLDFTPDMSRRARSIELWASMKYLGRSGISALVEQLHHHAKYFAEQLHLQGFNVLNEVVFNQIIVACDSQQQTEEMLKAIQSSQQCWCGGATWQGKSIIRISVCSWETTKTDLDNALQTFIAARKASD